MTRYYTTTYNAYAFLLENNGSPFDIREHKHCDIISGTSTVTAGTDDAVGTDYG